jgi:hypothetical protein
MPARAPFVTMKGPKAGANQESRRNLPPGSCLCSRRQLNQLQPKESANMPSSFTGTMATNWEFIPGSFCGVYALVRNVRQHRLPRKQDKSDFQLPISNFQLKIHGISIGNWKSAIGNQQSQLL